MDKLGNSELNPIFESLESRILLSGSPAPDAGPEEAVFAESGHQESAAELEVSEVLFVDENVEGTDVLLESLNRNVQVITINGSEDGLSQIHNYLSDHSDLSAIHIFSHGSAGQLSLGSSNIDFNNLNNQQTLQLQEIGKSFSSEADLFIYGCDFADSTEAVDTLSSLTGLDIAASTDLTGNSELGGDWRLEYSRGEVEGATLFSTEGMTKFKGILPAPDYSGIPNTNIVLHLDAQNIDSSGNDNLDDGDAAVDWSADNDEWKDQSGVSADGRRLSGNNSVVDFDGLADEQDGVDIIGGGFTVANNARTNLSTQDEYSISAVFKTGTNVTSDQTIYEQGGTTRGYGIFIFNENIFAGVWNNASGEWDTSDKHRFIDFGKAEANKVYSISIVHDSESDSVGTLKGFSNGKLVGEEAGIGIQRAHSGAIGIGQTQNGAKMPDGSNAGTTRFQGNIGEILIWDDALSSSEITDLATYSNSRWSIPDELLPSSITEVTTPGSNLNTGDTVSLSIDFDEDMTLSADATLSVDVEVDNLDGTTSTFTASFTNGDTDLTAQSFTLTSTALVADHFDIDGIEVQSNSLTVTGGTLQNGASKDVTGNSSKVLDIKVDSTDYRDLHAVSEDLSLHFDAQFLGLADNATVTSIENLSETANATNSGGTKTYDIDGINERQAIRLDGSGGFNIANNTLLNTFSNSTPKEQYSIGLVFKTGTDITSDQTVYEQGGGLRGYGVHLQGEELFFGAWNKSEWDAGHEHKFASLGEIKENTVYFITLVHEATDLSTGTLKIYNNGVLATEIDHVGVQRAHSGGIGFGRINGDTVYPDENSKGGPRGFDGHLGEIAIWNDALDNGQISELNSYFGNHWGINTAPEITSITSALLGGDSEFGIGESISVNVNFSESVTLSDGETVSVTIQVDVEGGGTRDFIASYTNSSGSSETFSSLVLSTPVLAATDLLDLNGVDVIANSFSVTNDALVDAGGNSVGTSPSENLAITVDTTIANILSASITSDNYSLGELITVDFTASKAGLTLSSGTLGGINLQNFQDLGGGSYSAQITVPVGLEATSLTTNIVLDDGGTNTDPFVQPIDISPGRVDGVVPVVNSPFITVSLTELVGNEELTVSWDNSAAGDNNADVDSVLADVSFLGGPSNLILTDSGSGVFTASFIVTGTPGLVVSDQILLSVTDIAGNTTQVASQETLNLSIPDNFIPPVNNFVSVDGSVESSDGVNIPPVLDPGVRSQSSLQFLSSGSNLQFEQEFLSEDYLSVISGVFNGNIDPESEVADVGGVEQEVKDQNVYDESQLPQDDLKFIEDLMQESDSEETEPELEEELSFESSKASFQELAELNIEEAKPFAQKDLDNKINLEDTLVGDFDCFKAE